MFIIMQGGFMIASKNEYFDENILSDDWEFQGIVDDQDNIRSLQMTPISDFIKKNHTLDIVNPVLNNIKAEELEGDLQAITRDSFSDLTEEDTQLEIQAYRPKERAQKACEQGVFSQIKKKNLESMVHEDLYKKGSFITFEIVIDHLKKTINPSLKPKFFKATISRKQQKEAAYIVQENMLSNFSQEEQNLIKIYAHRYERKKQLDKNFAERKKNKILASRTKI